jgi:CHAT domain-containing protein
MDGNFYFGKNATEYNFKVQAPSFKIIHLALHGSANTNTGNCKILFTSGGSKNEDGILYDYELYAMKLNARLAVLSACETGAGKYYKGEGIFSMARGFMYAGCPAVVMSYWKINDLNTTKQMGYFYRYLKEHESINTSLRKAKLEFLHNADNISAHPVNWASMNAWGKTDVKLEKAPLLGIFLLIAIALLTLIYFFKKRMVLFKP